QVLEKILDVSVAVPVGQDLIEDLLLDEVRRKTHLQSLLHHRGAHHQGLLQLMSWRPSFCGSKFRHVFGKPSTKEHGYDGVPITRGVHDNHYCSANPCFIAVVTECAGGGSFLVLPIHHTGRVDPQHPRVCGHRGSVLDVKWNPFDDHCVASCSEDGTDQTRARKTLIGHSRRVALIEWHPTAENLLLSSAYDYKVLLWDVSQDGAVLRYPARVVLTPVLHRHPSDALLLSLSFNRDGSRLAVTSKDRRVRVLDPRTGRILQVSSCKSHRASKVLYIGGLKMLKTWTDLQESCSPSTIQTHTCSTWLERL
ncbi:hypothetical protein FQN60_013291, partial [Etheostoma spectabile]